MMRARAAAVAAAGIGFASALSCVALPARAGGVSYIVGGQGGAASGVARNASLRVRAEDAAAAHGVVLTGARLAIASTPSAERAAAPRRAACAGCNYAALAPIIRAVSHHTDVDPALVAAVIDVESGFDRDALSPAGARGLMQLMPATAWRFGVSDVNDPVQNIAAGSLYLGQLIRQFSGNLRYALAAYNAGEASVRSYGGIPPFAETQAYVPRVLSRYVAFRKQFGAANDAPFTGPQPPLHMMLTEYR